jgi:hypothetical protein
MLPKRRRLNAGADHVTEGTEMTRYSLLALAFGFTGCVVDSHHPHQEDYSPSTLIVDWTVDGSTDPAECRQGATPTIDITIETRSGAFVDEVMADCEAFETSIDLDPGTYQASALLLDDSGRDATTTVGIDPFTLLEADQLDVSVDFPADSFL